MPSARTWNIGGENESKGCNHRYGRLHNSYHYANNDGLRVLKRPERVPRMCIDESEIYSEFEGVHRASGGSLRSWSRPPSSCEGVLI